MTTTAEQALVASENAPLQSLAAKINAAHDEALASVRTALGHACRAGDLLLEAKRQLGHGAWLPWLRQHCTTVSERTAQKYMQLARELPKLTANTPPRATDLSLRGALALLSERAESQIEDDANGRLNLDDRNNWTSEFRACFELIEGARKTLADAEQDFSTYVSTFGTSDAEAREFMRAVMTKLLDIETEVARIRNRPKPTRPEVVADEMWIRTMHRDVDAALADALREALEPTEEMRQMWASQRRLEQVVAMMREIKDEVWL